MEYLPLVGTIVYVLMALLWTGFACAVQYAFYGAGKRRLLFCALLNFLLCPICMVYGAATFKKRLKEYVEDVNWYGSPWEGAW